MVPVHGGKRYVLIVAVATAALGLLGVASYFQGEIRTYVSLGGWNQGAARQVVGDFLRLVHEGKTERAVALLDAGSYTPFKKKDKVVRLDRVDPSGMARDQINVSELISAGKARVRSVQIRATDHEAAFIVLVEFGDKSRRYFAVKRLADGYKITLIGLMP